MRQNIALYIGNMQVEFSTPPQILYSYILAETQNPTVVRNSYSKSITIEGTAQNNRIFGHYWNIERSQLYDDSNTGVYFNASLKTPFTLYVDGDVYESGYVKLEEIKKNRHTIYYSIALRGGLGDFLYNLSENADGDKLKLSDLHYMTWDTGTTSADEFDFLVNKETLDEAWTVAQSPTDSSKWGYINFAPVYNGLPDDFDSDKVLINHPDFDANIIPSAVTEGGKTYSVVDGYSVATLKEQIDEHTARDYRCRLQRPVIRVKEVINACCAGENNKGEDDSTWIDDEGTVIKGYKVLLDPEWFNVNNPYWEDTWMTLPLMTEMEFRGRKGIDDEVSLGIPQGSISSYVYNISPASTEGFVFGDVQSMGISFKMRINPQDDIASDRLWLSKAQDGIGGKNTWWGGIKMQLVGYDENGNAIASSNIHHFTNSIQVNDYSESSFAREFDVYDPETGLWHKVRENIPVLKDIFAKASDEQMNAYRPGIQARTVIHNGCFVMDEDWQHFHFEDVDGNDIVNMTLQGVEGGKIASIKLYVDWWSNNAKGALLRLASKRVFPGTYASTIITGFTLDLQGSRIIADESDTLQTGSLMRKDILLDTSYTPADFLLSYIKMFGLYITKDVDSKTIRIQTRNTFYLRNDVINLEDYIGRDTDIKITPTTFSNKWIDFQATGEDATYYEDYLNASSVPYGTQRVDTGYNFDRSSKDIMDKVVFKGAVECLEKSKYNFADIDGIMAYMFDSATEELRAPDDSTTTVNIPSTDWTTFGNINPQGLKYYDIFPKMQSHSDDGNPVDCSSVLLFLTGMQEITPVGVASYACWLSDDNPYMDTLNGNACWLMTKSEYDLAGRHIAIPCLAMPRFERYRKDFVTGNVLQSLDYGNPKHNYLPGYINTEGSTVYTNCWKTYIEDMYNINSKVLDCRVHLDKKPNPDWLRRFYWFDNAIWRLEKITDWDVSSFDTTKMQFVKVQDRENYRNKIVNRNPDYQLIAFPTEIPYAGGTIFFEVIASDGGEWFLNDTISNGIAEEGWSVNIVSGEMTADATSVKGTGDCEFELNITIWTGTTDREIVIGIEDMPAAVTITQEGMHISNRALWFGKTDQANWNLTVGGYDIDEPLHLTVKYNVGGFLEEEDCILPSGSGIVSVTTITTEQDFASEASGGRNYELLGLWIEGNEAEYTDGLVHYYLDEDDTYDSIADALDEAGNTYGLSSVTFGRPIN